MFGKDTHTAVRGECTDRKKGNYYFNNLGNCNTRVLCAYICGAKWVFAGGGEDPAVQQKQQGRETSDRFAYKSQNHLTFAFSGKSWPLRGLTHSCFPAITVS